MQNLQIKDRLAKLLAGENLIVEHRQVSTASFDVEKRILTLPMWVMESASAYDMLIGHEVGHALYTPLHELTQFLTNRNTYMDGKYSKVKPSHVNIIEDVRIEKMLQKKFPGFRKTFQKGYYDLYEMNFFELKDREVDALTFMDRLNLYFKLGSNIIIKFTDEEMDMIEKVKNNIDTFEDVLDYCVHINEFISEYANIEKEDIDVSPSSNNSSGDDNNENTESNLSDSDYIPDIEDYKDDTENSNNKENPSIQPQNFHDDDNDDVTTQESFNKKLKDLIDTETYERTYLDIPEVKIENIIISPDKIENECKSYNRRWIDMGLDTTYFKFKKDSQSSVNYMIKEFQTKKSADDYARTGSARTGILDTKKLHSYKFNEDIFKQIKITKEGQNHGMIFLVDWSGSMQDCILETTKQLLQLVWFCRKQNIPFDVYSFTNNWNKNTSDPDYLRFERYNNRIQNIEHNEIQIDPQLNLLNVISSKRSSKEFDNDCFNFFTVAYLTKEHYGLGYPSSLALNSTPLNSAIISLREIIPEFYKTSKVDSLSTIILTDGESDYMTYYVKYSDSSLRKFNPNNENFYTSHVNRCVIRDVKIGYVYPELTSARSFYSYQETMNPSTMCLLNNLKDNFPDMNLIGIRLVASRESQEFLRVYADDHKCRAMWAKEKNVCVTDTPYDILYGMSTSILNKDTSINVSEDASITKINSAIKKSLQAKNANRKMLSSFVSTIA